MRDTILQAIRSFEQLHEGYTSWGKVDILCVVIKEKSGRILITNPSLEISDIHTEQDIIEANDCTHEYIHFAKEIFAKRKSINSIFFSRHEYASQIQKNIPPILDDQAQLLGVSVKVCNHNATAIVSALIGRYAAITKNGLCITLGNSIEDNYVAAQLLEKTSKCFIESESIGGAKTINCVEAWLMQQFYLFKYSKAAEKNK